MESQEYIFNDAHDQRELERLQAIEAVFDPETKAQLNSTGLSNGWQCLEIGPGAGSIMDWLAERVGPEGRVVGVDINPRFLERKDSHNIEILKADIRAADLGRSRFDLIHERYVLIHIPEFQSVLERLFEVVKPQGWIVVEEPDFSSARPICGPQEACDSVERVNLAIRELYTGMGIDHAIALKLPAALHALGIRDFQVENHAPIACGGSGVARIMKMSIEQLRDRYIATGVVTPRDLDVYCEFAEDPDTWAVYYATITITAQAPGDLPPGNRTHAEDQNL